jgi:LysM domain-containing protein
MSGPGLPRFAVLAGAALAVSDAVRRLVTPPLRALASAAPGGTATDLPLVTVVAGGCAAALAACWIWLVVCAALVALDAARQGGSRRGTGAPPARPPFCPAWVRTLVLVVLGLGLGAGPALADAPAAPRDAQSAAGAPRLDGLALPDRVASPHRSVVRVRAGDTLWAIAARRLPPSAPDATVDRAWRRLARANADRLGDPDLIFPGTFLRVPDLDRPSRKEAP